MTNCIPRNTGMRKKNFLTFYIFINIKILINSLKQFKYENLLCLASVFSILAVAYLAGHVLGWSFPMFILVFITGLNSVLGSDL